MIADYYLSPSTARYHLLSYSLGERSIDTQVELYSCALQNEKKKCSLLHQRILLENEKEKQDEEGGDEF